MPTTTDAGPAIGRRFGVTVGSALVVLALVSWWRGHVWPPAVLGASGGLLLLAALLVPRHLVPIERRWMAGARAIARVTTPLLVGLVFYVVVTPMGLLMRALGRHPLRHPLVNDSYWHTRDAAQRGSMTEKF